MFFVTATLAVLWNWVVARSSKGVATQNAFQGEPGSFKWTVFYNCLFCVLRAGGGVAAGCRCERRDALLVEFYEY